MNQNSMKKKKSGNKKILFFLTAILIGAIAIAFISYKDFEPKKMEPPREIVIQRGSIETAVLATGEVKPENRLEIKPPLEGRIEEVLVDEGQAVKAGQILAWMSSNERAALLDAARAKGEEEVQHWSKLYRPIPIIAPLPGNIIYRNVEAGQTFGPGNVIFAMSNRLLVKAQVDETDLSQIKLHQRAKINLDAYSDEQLIGKVSKISFESKLINNVTTYTVDVTTKTIPTFMRSGMTANIAFVIASKKNVVLVPVEAIIYKDKATYVSLKAPGQPPLEKQVKIGFSDGRQNEVISGLVEGDVVLAPRFSVEETKKTRSLFGVNKRTSGESR